MPNWNQIVSEHLMMLRLPGMRDRNRRGVCAHLEAAYEDAIAAGMPEAEAVARAMQGLAAIGM
ncbi:MAG: hypothetical protein J2P21_33655 [Chloracidobacterium sp.]|nr:hypothetical protein [Chloracidobacterium sp.]